MIQAVRAMTPIEQAGRYNPNHFLLLSAGALRPILRVDRPNDVQLWNRRN